MNRIKYIVWLFFVVSLFVNAYSIGKSSSDPRSTFKKTQEIISKIEKLTGMSFVSYWNSTSGSICSNDVFAISEIIQPLTPGKDLGIFLKSSGGNVETSLRIVHLLRQKAKKMTALIPLECASSATLVSLGCEEIQMGPLAYLTSIDFSLNHELAPLNDKKKRASINPYELRRAVKLWEDVPTDSLSNPYPTLYQYVHPLVIGSLDRMSSLSVKICEDILSFHMDDTVKINELANQLNAGYPSHAYPIIIREVKRLGLNAKPLSSELNELLLQLNSLYSELAKEIVVDRDAHNYHRTVVANITEATGSQLVYQFDNDWHYSKTQKKWVTMNDESGWYKSKFVKNKVVRNRFYIR
jgi:hypothetical protein